MAGAGAATPLPVAREAGVLPAEEKRGKRRGGHRRGSDTKTGRGSGKHPKLQGQPQTSHTDTTVSEGPKYRTKYVAAAPNWRAPPPEEPKPM